uniref:NADH-ubiquinone oxidoreductase chain 3 n=1 Tax=Salinator rhamphidia TaxID=981055 RepID=G8HR54_9GAST|nr:NADH dehydrogenase subunit 3 [Salinator rhamphidia]AEQ93902.1 NADH dehydrogenase subunit 3 [Salinator rhamphidia]
MLYMSFGFAVILGVALPVVFFLTSFLSETSSEKLTAFECGFDPLSEMRAPFSTRFFILVVLFLIFDVEIALLFPVLAISTFSASVFLMLGMSLFLAVLLLGLFHEWSEGSLDWVSS